MEQVFLHPEQYDFNCRGWNTYLVHTNPCLVTTQCRYTNETTQLKFLTTIGKFTFELVGFTCLGIKD